LAFGLLLGAAGLGGCEYVDAGPSSSGSPGPQSPVTDPPPDVRDPQEEARVRELIADVEAQLGPESENRVVSSMGGMRQGAGTTVMGTAPDSGTYLVRAACSPGPSAELNVHQAGAPVVRLHVACGNPRETVLELQPGPVSASLEPLGHEGLSVGAVRLETVPR
jgi:hypothetical protein